MGIRLFDIDFDSVGSVLCAITSIVLIVFALLALLQLGEYILREVF